MQEETVFFQARAGAGRLIVFCGGRAVTCPLVGTQTFGRPSSAGVPDISADSGVVSRRHGLFTTQDGLTRYQALQSTNGTLCNGTELAPGTERLLLDGDVLRVHGRDDADCAMDVLLIYTTQPDDTAVWRRQALDGDTAEVVIGRSADFSLDRSVSRRHASFFRTEKGWAIIDHDSLNGVWLNQKRLQRPCYLSPYDVVRIAGHLFIFTGDAIFYQADVPAEDAAQDLPRHGSDALSVWIEERNVWNRMKKKTLLKDIRLEIPTGSMVLILGGSGAGKTTFMNAVMGYERAEGEIRYRGTDIYDEYEKMKYEIGYVPQQDLMRMNDTVYDTLMNAARMRMPAHLAAADYAQGVERTIALLGLDRVRDSLVGKLSGGQRKRLSIAVEYIGNPSLFFLDEPDSGLDGTMARALMENLRTIADDGKIVMVISHSPDRAFDLWDLVIVLAKDSRDDVGHLVFFGPPKDACAFFEVSELERIVRRLNAPDEGGDGLADQYIERFAKTRGQT